MSASCPEPTRLVALEDGEATENEAADLRRHLTSCASCRAEYEAIGALRKEIAGPVVDVDVQRLAARVALAIQEERPRRGMRLWLLAAATLGIGLVALFVARPREEAEFAARGGSAVSGARRDVSLSLFEQRGDRLMEIAPGSQVDRSALFAMSWSTRGATTAHRAVVVAIDSGHEVHWLYPAFLGGSPMPEPIGLAARQEETPMPTSVRLEEPALGPLVVIALLDPVGSDVVAKIEGSNPSERTPDGLRLLVKAADVRSWPLTLVAGEGGR